LGYEHIISDFKSKDIRYILSREKNTSFKVIDINNFKKFFDIKCVLRRKPSGSSPVSKTKLEQVIFYLKRNFNAFSVNDTSSKKLLFKSNSNGLLGTYFRLENEKYFISKEKFEGFFRVTRTSKTNNLNVIFEIHLINYNLKDDMKSFLEDLSV